MLKAIGKLFKWMALIYIFLILMIMGTFALTNIMLASMT